MESEEHAVMPLAGGIMQHGYQCGMVWGSALAAGAEACRLYGTGPQAEVKAIAAARRVVESFRALSGHVDCFEITGMNKSSSTMKMIEHFFLKGGAIRCFSMAAAYAPIAFSEINAAFSETDIDLPSGPVSCSTMLAKKIGASDIQATMTAGFAGGIGLSGGACGALGTAIWIDGTKRIERSGGKISYISKEGAEIIEKFLKSSDYEFECSQIVGRKFESVADHASYVLSGGCSKITDALAAGSFFSDAAASFFVYKSELHPASSTNSNKR